MTGDEMKTWRAKLALTQDEFGGFLGMGIGNGRKIRRWENGENPIPRLVDKIKDLSA